MTLEEYLAFTADYSYYPEANTGSEKEVVYLALGLAGESGESVDIIKKLIRGDFPDGVDNHDMREKLALELGDVFWYWMRLVWWLGLTPEQVMQMNYRKLKARIAARPAGVAQPFPPPKGAVKVQNFAVQVEAAAIPQNPTYSFCSVCHEPQYETAAGITCAQGHEQKGEE